MGTGVRAPEALFLKCARNDLFCYNRIGWRRWCVSGMSGVCLWREFTFQRSKSAMQRDEIKHPPSSNFSGRTGRSYLPSFFMDRCPKNEATAKNFVWNKSSSHSQEKWKNLLGGGEVDVTPTLIGGLNL